MTQTAYLATVLSITALLIVGNAWPQTRDESPTSSEERDQEDLSRNKEVRVNTVCGSILSSKLGPGLKTLLADSSFFSGECLSVAIFGAEKRAAQGAENSQDTARLACIDLNELCRSLSQNDIRRITLPPGVYLNNEVLP
jgi:hypothetical protein